jgi:hypothetical protein
MRVNTYASDQPMIVIMANGWKLFLSGMGRSLSLTFLSKKSKQKKTWAE